MPYHLLVTPRTIISPRKIYIRWISNISATASEFLTPCNTTLSINVIVLCRKNHVLLLSTYMKSYSVTHAVINVSIEFILTENSLGNYFNQLRLCCKYWLCFELFIRFSINFPVIISFLGHECQQVKCENKTHNDIFKNIYCKNNIHIFQETLYAMLLCFSTNMQIWCKAWDVMGQMRKKGLPNGKDVFGNSAK